MVIFLPLMHWFKTFVKTSLFCVLIHINMVCVNLAMTLIQFLLWNMHLLWYNIYGWYSNYVNTNKWCGGDSFHKCFYFIGSFTYDNYWNIWLIIYAFLNHPIVYSDLIIILLSPHIHWYIPNLGKGDKPFLFSRNIFWMFLNNMFK